MFERNKQTLGKEKARKRKIKENQIHECFLKGADGQKAKKAWSFEREDNMKTRKENRIGKKRRILKTSLLGTQKNNSKTAGK